MTIFSSPLLCHPEHPPQNQKKSEKTTNAKEMRGGGGLVVMGPKEKAHAHAKIRKKEDEKKWN